MPMQGGNGWRAKLYELESTGTWLDQGTGYVNCELDSSLGYPTLVMYGEQGEEVLLQSKIQSDELYEKQGECLILWKEASFSRSIDYALSFQDSDGCAAVWSTIRSVQAQYLQQREYGNIPSFARSQRVHTQASEAESNENLFEVLPSNVKEPGKLKEIKMRLDNLHVSQRDFVSAQLLAQHCAYLLALFDLFTQLESKNETEELQLLADVMRCILLLNDPSIIEYLLSDHAFSSVAGIFEYDRALREKGTYRTYMQSSDIKTVVQLSPEIVAASTFLFRLRFVRDIMLHPTIDEPGITSINSMITFTSGEICYQVLMDRGIIQQLFRIMLPSTESNGDAKGGEKSAELRLDALRFFRELVTMSKFIMLEKRVEIYRIFFGAFRKEFYSLITYIFSGAIQSLRARTILPAAQAAQLNEEAFDFSLPNQSLPPQVVFSSMKKTVLSPYRTLVSLESSAFYDTASTSEALWIAAEILASFVTTHPSLLRQEVIETPPPAWGPGASPETIAADSSWMHKNILFLLIDLIGNAHDSATIDLLGDCLKAFLDVGKGVVQGKAEKDQGLQQFYDHYIAWLMVPFTDNNTPAEPISNAYYRARGMAALHCVEKYSSLQPHSALSTSRRVLFEVLCLCVASHSYRMKYFLIRSNSIAKIVSKTFSSSDRHLQILSLKFVKQLLKSKDEFYLRHIDKLDLLKPIFLAFKSIAHKDNLLTSNVYDLLETIRVENLSTLILYIVEKYAECFDDVQHVEVFDRLRLRYDQLRDRTQGTSVFSAATASGSSTNNSRPRAQSMDDDEYFFGGDDGESDAASSENGSVDLADEHRDKRFCHDDSMGTQNDSNLPPSFFDKLRHKGTPAKPPSPPHYSHRVHGTPLDGEGPPSDAALNISAHIGPSRSPQSPSGGEVLALLSHYSDDSEDSPFSDTKSLPATEDDSMTHLPPIKPKFSEDHDDEMGFFRARRADGSEMEDKKAGGQDDGAVGGISFVLKKKRARML